MKLSRKVKDILFVSYLFICVFGLTIGGLVLQDYAESSFWQNFWTYSPIAGVVGLIGGIWWKSQQRETPNQDGQ